MSLYQRCVTFSTKDLCNLRVALRADQNCVPDGKKGEEFNDVVIAQPNTAMRRRFADGTGLIGSVNAVAVNAQTHPAGAEWIIRARRDDGAVMRVTRMSDAAHDLKFADGAGTILRPNRNEECSEDAPFSRTAS